MHSFGSVHALTRASSTQALYQHKKRGVCRRQAAASAADRTVTESPRVRTVASSVASQSGSQAQSSAAQRALVPKRPLLTRGAVVTSTQLALATALHSGSKPAASRDVSKTMVDAAAIGAAKNSKRTRDDDDDSSL
jgi:hypothetical protein